MWTSNLASTFTGPSQQKPVKNFGKKDAWAYPGTAQLFGLLPIISGMAYSWQQSEEKPIKNCGKSSRWHWHSQPQVLRKIFRALMYRAHCTVIYAIAQLPCPRIFTGFRDIEVFVPPARHFSHLTSSLLKIFPCSPGNRYMTFGLGRAKCSANCPCN